MKLRLPLHYIVLCLFVRGVLVKRSVCYSNSISYELLKHEGTHADKETKHKNIFEYVLLSFQMMAWNDSS